ncbi:HvfC family RiPP maturation protein [Marinagarivorans algicola]|uniref:HvfC family RiPP maturation protein n=1 Tax=Marinagarivorans algicola TaxID=1513270 RepID=UPI0037362E28
MTQFSPKAPKGLVDFQASYGTYLRQPNARQKPKNIPARASRIYEELFFNNICGFISNCFPVAKSLFPADQWLAFSRAFFTEWRCRTPYFSEIPKEFVSYIKQGDHTLCLPPWFCELIEYEWLELEVDICNAVPLKQPTAPAKSSSNQDNILYANPTLRNHTFEWPVHTISPDCIPETPETTFLAIYRDPSHRVQFMAMNAMTCALLEIITKHSSTAEHALLCLAETIHHPDPAQIVAFGTPIIDDFLHRGMLVSLHPS